MYNYNYDIYNSGLLEPDASPIHSQEEYEEYEANFDSNNKLQRLGIAGILHIACIQRRLFSTIDDVPLMM